MDTLSSLKIVIAEIPADILLTEQSLFGFLPFSLKMAGTENRGKPPMRGSLVQKYKFFNSSLISLMFPSVKLCSQRYH